MGASEYIRILRRIPNVLLGRDIFFHPEAKHYGTVERLGSDYGGWSIITNEIRRDSVIYSFGIGEDASFDLALINRYGVFVHAFDPTRRSIEWVQAQHFPAQFILHEYGLAASDGEVAFNPPENAAHISHTILDRPSTHDRAVYVPVKRLQTIMASLGHQTIDLLKVDIEGAEYAVIQDLRMSSIYPKQILVEFHHRFPNIGICRTKTAIAELRSMGYFLFAASASGEEFGFVHAS